MDEIAQELGISKKTIYQHFQDKDELIYKAVESWTDCKTEDVLSINSCSNVVERLLLMNEIYLTHVTKIKPTTFFEIRKYHPRAWQIFEKNLRENVLLEIIDDLNRGIADGYFRSDIDVPVLARLRLKEIEFGFDEQWFPTNDFPITHLHFTFMDHFLRGILNESGLALYTNYLASQAVA